jgi:leucyl aminopeptidase
VLADCLTHAREQGAERLLDVATLTGAIQVALGGVFAGLFADDDAWAGLVLEAGARAGERSWRMPVDRDYDDAIKGKYADIANAVEDRKAGACVAAAFLNRFTDGVPWAHLDIAGVMSDRGLPYAAKGASGFGVRTLVEVARAVAENAAR